MSRRWIVLTLVTLTVTAVSLPGQDAASLREKVVAGGPDAFMEVRHLVLRGSQEDIGRSLAAYARRQLGARPFPRADRRTSRVQLRYLEQVWPTHLARMRGAAAAFGSDLSDPRRDFTCMPYDMAPLFGCSVAFFPGTTTKSGRSVLSRNLDFTTGDLTRRSPRPGGRAAVSRPFVVETYPDEGHPCLFTAAFDLLGSAMDGINAKGLTVAMLTDRELMNRFQMEPSRRLQVGLNEIQTVRYLLERCADVEEAKDALLLLKRYYFFLPCHYVVGDASGQSFIFEDSAGRNLTHVLEGDGQTPQISTNFSLHLHPKLEDVKPEPHPEGSMNRFCRLREMLDRTPRPWTVDHFRAAAAHVAFASPARPGSRRPPNRTLWHALYDTGRKSLSIDFYLGEKADPDRPGRTLAVRSGYREFRLNP